MFFSEHVMYSITFVNLTGEFPKQSYRYYSVQYIMQKNVLKILLYVLYFLDIKN